MMYVQCSVDHIAGSVAHDRSISVHGFRSSLVNISSWLPRSCKGYCVVEFQCSDLRVSEVSVAVSGDSSKAIVMLIVIRRRE